MHDFLKHKISDSFERKLFDRAATYSEVLGELQDIRREELIAQSVPQTKSIILRSADGLESKPISVMRCTNGFRSCYVRHKTIHNLQKDFGVPKMEFLKYERDYKFNGQVLADGTEIFEEVI
jgi:hypothetical protein